MKLNEQNNQSLTKKERKELQRQEKFTEEQTRQRSRVIKKWTKRLMVIFILAGSVGGILWYGSSRPAVPTNELLTVVADD